MPMGKGTYGSQVGRPQKTKNSTDNYAQKKIGTGMNSTDNMNDGPIDNQMKIGKRKQLEQLQKKLRKELHREKLNQLGRDMNSGLSAHGNRNRPLLKASDLLNKKRKK